MQKTINLTKKEAIKFYNSAQDQGFKDLLETNFGKDFWKQEITDLVYDLDSLKEYCKNNNISFSLPYLCDTQDSLEKTLNATYILAKVAKIYNKGTILNWKNNNEYKYLPYLYFSGGSGVAAGVSFYWDSDLFASYCLYYKNSNLSTKSYNNFKKYWEDYWGVEQ
jgi:hypothetical protein